MKNYVEKKGIKTPVITYTLPDGRVITTTSLIPAPMQGHNNVIPITIDGKKMYCNLDDKPDLLKIINDKKATYEDDFLARYPGIDELLTARNDEETYHHNFNCMMDDEQNDGVNPPKIPEVSYSDACRKYPIAHAYLIILGYCNTTSCSEAGYQKSKAGKKAIEKIENGYDVVKAKNEMVDEYNNQPINIWD